MLRPLRDHLSLPAVQCSAATESFHPDAAAIRLLRSGMHCVSAVRKATHNNCWSPMKLELSLYRKNTGSVGSNPTRPRLRWTACRCSGQVSSRPAGSR